MSFYFDTLKGACSPSPDAFKTATIDRHVRPRLDSIDLLRGVVMVVMALDHTRDFFGAGGLNPQDVANPALFLTRWATHFCAPIFMLLAGMSAYLYGARGRSTAEISRFLFTRGFWLIVLEFTIVRFGWTFGIGLDVFSMLVIWAIGASMVTLAALVWLPRMAIGAIAIAMIAGHNLLDGIHAADLGSAGWIWNILHEPAVLTLGAGLKLRIVYPLIPWIGVMAVGYVLGPVFMCSSEERKRLLVHLGTGITLGFLCLRLGNIYGDPVRWVAHGTMLSTGLSMLNVQKYPPSLLYLMMTLGPGLLLLAAFEKARGKLATWITTFGRVPLLYYVAQLFLIHAVAIAVAVLAFDVWPLSPVNKPAGWGFALPVVYAVWALIVVSLYPLCRWFADVKRRRSDWWLSYL